MASKAILDAMIRRADFGLQTEGASVDLSSTLTIDQITGGSPYAKLLRKPDFQRETNHWSPLQVATLVKSFATGELIPALILWKSDSFIFVIDGGHRLSALKAWATNDYGDQIESLGFFSGNISEDQKRKARETRRLVENAVGRFSDFKSMTDVELSSGSALAKLASTIFSRSLQVQWIQGSSEVAEASFFKINSQGTVLDDVEELLLRNRRKSYAIAARAIVRSGTGHKYWSTFSVSVQEEIEALSNQINRLLFQPEIAEPIKTLDLPLGGTASPVDALKMLVDIFAIVDGQADATKAINALAEDKDGTVTVTALKRCLKVATRLTGNESGSLGLHPAVYFYNEQGKHSRFLFLGVLRSLSDHIRNNDKHWFKKFTSARGEIERLLVSKKPLVNQGLANVSNKQRIERVADLLNGLVVAFHEGNSLDGDLIISLLKLKGQPGTFEALDYIVDFNPEVKSAIFLKNALKTAIVCPICNGLISAMQSVSYDHIIAKVNGGAGQFENGQLSHPYCNQSVKGAD